MDTGHIENLWVESERDLRVGGEAPTHSEREMLQDDNGLEAELGRVDWVREPHQDESCFLPVLVTHFDGEDEF